jgi:hypothetical protein
MTLNTREAIHAMLTTNTGAHMLDSGGAYGRNWERNASKSLDDFITGPYSWMDNYGCLTISLFHHLDAAVDFEAAMDAEYLAFTHNSSDSHLEDISNWIEHIGGTEIYSDNSYNHESALSQVIQYTVYEFDGEQYVALQIHQGCDVRGGYTRPWIFSLSDEYALLSESGSVYCTGSEQHRYDYYGGEWTVEGCYSPEIQPYALQTEARKVGITEYIPCHECGYPLEGTDTRKEVSA